MIHATRGRVKADTSRVDEYLYRFFLFARVNDARPPRHEVQTNFIFEAAAGHSTSFADPFVFVTARPPTSLSAYKSFRQVGNKRRVLMDLRARPVSSHYRLILFFCPKTSRTSPAGVALTALFADAQSNSDRHENPVWIFQQRRSKLNARKLSHTRVFT